MARPLLVIILLDQVIQRRPDPGTRLDFHRCGKLQKEAAKLLLRRVADVDLVRNSPQERLVDQVARLKIRRKDDELVERHLDLPAAGQIEVIVAFLQRHDPAVQQRRGAHPLPAKIVDHQRAAVALQLQWRFGDARLRVGRDLQVVEDQLAADDDRGPADADPAMVDLSSSMNLRSLCEAAVLRGNWDRKRG